MNLHGFRVGVCSWSLHPDGAEDLVRQVRSLGLGHVQISLGPLVDLEVDERQREIQILLESGLEFTGGMISFPGEDYSTIAAIRQSGGIVPVLHWPQRKQRIYEAADVAEALGLRAITTHVGFIPPEENPRLLPFALRFGELLAAMQTSGIQLLMETGQESATELAKFLAAVEEVKPGLVGINFDPANMILYGAGDPIEAVRILGKWIGHVHVKDAVASAYPGEEWGSEVVFGMGQVGPARFLQALKSVGYLGPLAIEREAGPTRQADVAAAIAALRGAEI